MLRTRLALLSPSWPASAGMRRIALSAAAAVLMVPSLEAQTNASYTTFGTECGNGCAPRVRLVVQGLPQVGKTFEVSVGRHAICLAGQTYYFLLTGVSRTRWGSIPLPFSLPPFGTCQILVSGNIVTVPPTSLRVTFAVPNNTALIGAPFFQQWITAWGLSPAPAPPTLFATSNPGHGVIGT